MVLKEYQKRTLDRVQAYLEQLAKARQDLERVLQVHPKVDFDWPAQAWENATSGKFYQPRRNAIGDRLPTFCLKIPTGGGKTLLATRVIDLVNTYYHNKRAGLVLWVVPTTQIYNQTLRALKDRDHPYRQQLDLASAGRTRILEKASKFGPRDVEESLCILLLMLPSANRQTRERLRIFQDSGGFTRFFPPEDDAKRHRELLRQVPNLDTFEQKISVHENQLKTSLGNALRLLRPLILLDEGHKAYGKLARSTLEGFNPSMIVELSATPRSESNVLVEISGRELLAEEMIKLDLHIANSANRSWQDTLLASIEHRKFLEKQARTYEAKTGTYIRPICLVQVERTGNDQRHAKFVHAEDVRDYLLQHPDVRAEHIAIKTSQKDELREVDEIGGLQSRECPVRFIITKQALQEGWDCAFAYVLTILTNPSSQSALTQLVGRILRQPHARKTRVKWLDESYVFCFQRRGADLLAAVRQGFSKEGLKDLRGKVIREEEMPEASKPITVRQRRRYQQATRDLVLPAFMIKDGREWRLVHYEADILSRVAWSELDMKPLYNLPLADEGPKSMELRANLDDAQELSWNGEKAPESRWGTSADRCFAAKHLLDVVPNPWWGSEATRQVFASLQKKHSESRIAENYSYLLGEIRQHLEKERDRLSQRVFSALLEAGAIRFLVVAEDLEFNRLPRSIKTAEGRQANREDGSQYQLNLLERTNEEELNGLENKVATYLDQQERLFFWYRNRARKDYYVQGWKRGRIYADFIVTLRPDEPDASDKFHTVFVMETKGLHLERSSDTDYKREMFAICSQHARKKDWAKFVPAMQGKVMRFEVVDEREWQKKLHSMLA